MKWEGHAARMGDRRDTHVVWWGELMKGGHWEDVGLGRRIILKLVFKMDREAWIGLLWLMVGKGDRPL